MKASRFMLDVRKIDTGSMGVAVGLEAGGSMLSTDQAAQIKQLVYEHKLVVMRGVDLTAAAYVEFARKFGEPQIYFQPNYHHPQHPEIFVSANVDYSGKKFGVAATGRYWHSDYQFFEEPLPMTCVYPQEFTTGGRSTSFIDMVQAWDEMPGAMRAKLEHVRMRHDAKLCYKIQVADVDKSIAEVLEEAGRLVPPITHPAVITHPVTGRSSFFASPGFSDCPEGLDPSEGRKFMADVFAHITREERVYTQAWSEGDVLLWDNRTVMHRSDGSLDQPGRRVSFRIGIYDGFPFYVDSPEENLRCNGAVAQ